MVKEVETGNFREDLFYRLSVVPLIVPPLRKRGDDVVVLARHFLAQYAKKYNQPVPELTSDDRAMLKGYHWPGNVRELKNVIERAMVFSNGEELDLTIPRAPRKPSDVSTSFDSPFSDRPTMDELQRRYISYILTRTSRNRRNLTQSRKDAKKTYSLLATRKIPFFPQCSTHMPK